MIKTESNHLTGILRWPTPRAKRWVQAFLSTVDVDENVLAVIAIGSCVRPAVLSLDLDLVIICQRSPALCCRAPMEIDVRKFDAANVREEIASGNDLLGWCVKFGVTLFERSRFWTHILQQWSNNLPLPSAQAAWKRAEITKHRVQELERIGDRDAALEQEISYYTHIARATLIEHGVYPASRPELPAQLQQVGEFQLANEFDKVLISRRNNIAS